MATRSGPPEKATTPRGLATTTCPQSVVRKVLALMVHDGKVVGHRAAGFYPEVWVRFLSDKQLKREIRRHLKTALNLDRATNSKLNLLLTEAEQRADLKDWLARCLEMLEANAAEEAERAAEASTITPLPQRDRAAS